MLLDEICLHTAITIISASFLKKSKLIFWCIAEFLVLFILYKLMNTFFPQLFFFSIYILMIVPFIIFFIQKNKLLDCLFNTAICMGGIFLFIFTWGKLFQIFTEYTPNNYTTFYDIVIGSLIVITSILFYIFYEKKVKYKFNFSVKNQILIIIQICFFIVFFTMIYPLMMYSNSMKLHAAGSLIFIIMMFIFIKIVVYVLNLEKIKEISKNEFEIALNLKKRTDEQQYFIIETEHYFKGLILNIGYFLAMKDYDGLENYYNEKLVKTFNEMLKELNTEGYIFEAMQAIDDNEMLVRAALHQYYVKAKNLKNVHFSLTINSYIDSFYIDREDLFEILNIILSNAIEELESIELTMREKLFAHLFVSIEKDTEKIKFLITNTVNPVKTEKLNHYGEGIKIARRLEKQYKNRLEIQLIPQEKVYKSIIEIRI